MLSYPSLARTARTLAFRSARPFAASAAPREHHLDADVATFDAQIKLDQVTLVDFYAECVFLGTDSCRDWMLIQLVITAGAVSATSAALVYDRTH